MSALIDSIPIPVHIFERRQQGDLVLVQSNSASAALLGAHMGESAGKTIAELFPGRWGCRAMQYLEKAWHWPGPLNVVHRMPGASEQRVYNTTLAAQTNEQGEVVRLIVTNQDASLFSEMRTRLVCAESRNKDMGRLVFRAAHDLRAPMRNVKVISELLRDDLTNDVSRKAELIDLLEQISENSLTTVTAILNTVSTANRQQRQMAINLAEMCEDLQQILDPLNEHKIHSNNVHLYVDDRLLRTVARNLIYNAIRHGGRDSMTISVTAAAAAMPDMLQLEVSDNGNGFEKPGAVHDAASLDNHLSGFGLSTIENMLSGCGGSISFANAPEGNHGAIVTAVIPGAVCSDRITR